MKNKIFSFTFLILICFNFFSCVSTEVNPVEKFSNLSNDIIILYENDVHCNVDGYAKISALKNELVQENFNVGIVSSGDFIQGSSLGSISQGEYIVNIMNLIEYDAVTLGNHEFDYRLPRLLELTDILDAPVVCSNFIKLEENDFIFEPYTIVSYEDVDVAYIGVTTPSTISNSSPAQFMDDAGKYLYSFSGENLYRCVQKNIDDAKSNGADVIILLSHLGTENVLEKWSCQELVKNIFGVDVVLDGHSHSTVEKIIIKDKKNRDVIISSTGTQFENIGKLTISKSGKISTELISVSSLLKTDDKISSYITQIKEEYKNLGERLIGNSKVNLITHDENKNRIIRNNETNLGDFCADAFRFVTNSDIGVINGGGIRAEIKKGEVTFNDLLNVFPWNNTVCVVEVYGNQIIDFLEFSTKDLPYENGSFQHVSGITFQVDTSIPSSVKIDDKEIFINIEGERRVSNVKVLNRKTNIYEDIIPEKKYTLASHNYLLKEKGSGASMLNNSKMIIDDGMLDVELLEIYLKDFLNGNISNDYEKPQDRIVIK